MSYSYSYSYSYLSVEDLLLALLPSIVIGLVCLLICLKIATSRGASKAFCLFGLLGIIGVILTAVITANRQNMNNNYPNNAGVYPNGAGGNPNMGMGNYQNGQNRNYVSPQNGFNNQAGNQYQNFNSNIETVNSDNYEFKGSMNVCGTHDGEYETYDSTYEGYGERHDYSYNLNGENIRYEKNVCHHCGAKLKTFAKFCEECGSRV